MNANILPPQGIVLPGLSVLVTMEVFEDDGALVCGLYQLKGRISLPPKQWLQTVRTEMQRLERIAKAAGCSEMRVAGRNWSRVLPDYQPLAGLRNGLRKAL